MLRLMVKQSIKDHLRTSVWFTYNWLPSCDLGKLYRFISVVFLVYTVCSRNEARLADGSDQNPELIIINNYLIKLIIIRIHAITRWE